MGPVGDVLCGTSWENQKKRERGREEKVRVTMGPNHIHGGPGWIHSPSTIGGKRGEAQPDLGTCFTSMSRGGGGRAPECTHLSSNPFQGKGLYPEEKLGLVDEEAHYQQKASCKEQRLQPAPKGKAKEPSCTKPCRADGGVSLGRHQEAGHLLNASLRPGPNIGPKSSLHFALAYFSRHIHPTPHPGLPSDRCLFHRRRAGCCIWNKSSSCSASHQASAKSRRKELKAWIQAPPGFAQATPLALTLL